MRTIMHFLLRKKEKKNKAPEPVTGYPIYAPVTGLVKNISESPEPAFSSKKIGDGVFILPVDNKIYAPADCNIAFIFPSRHAIGLRTKNDVELLINLGFGTEHLKGTGFHLYVSEDQDVTRGDLIADFDLQKIKTRCASSAISVLVTNLNETQHLLPVKNGNVTLEDILFEIE